MTLGAGTKLGPYEIVPGLGTGGMGELYPTHIYDSSRITAGPVVMHLTCLQNIPRENR
jgi:hypothetical protein